jgi:Ca-activated chloride channel homolog
MCTLGSGKSGGLSMDDVEPTNGCGQTMSAFERAKVHSGTKSDWLLGQMLTGGPEYLDAVITNEAEVVAFNLQNGSKLREPLVAVYPRDGTVLFSHPYAILDGAPWVTPEQVSAAKAFGDFLLTRDQQEALLSLGLRPGDPSVKLGAPLEPAAGVNPAATLTGIGLPEPLVIDRVVEVWHQVRKPAAIALVLDKSGSMSGSKIGAAISGARAFLDRMDRGDWIYWLPFDHNLYPGVRGPKSEIGEQLATRYSSLGGREEYWSGGLRSGHLVVDGRSQAAERPRRGDRGNRPDVPEQSRWAGHVLHDRRSEDCSGAAAAESLSAGGRTSADAGEQR